jgi:hypothetical protein
MKHVVILAESQAVLVEFLVLMQYKHCDLETNENITNLIKKSVERIFLFDRKNLIV